MRIANRRKARRSCITSRKIANLIVRNTTSNTRRNTKKMLKYEEKKKDDIVLKHDEMLSVVFRVGARVFTSERLRSRYSRMVQLAWHYYHVRH